MGFRPTTHYPIKENIYSKEGKQIDERIWSSPCRWENPERPCDWFLEKEGEVDLDGQS